MWTPHSLRDVVKQPKGLAITLAVNWLIKPFTMAALGVLFFIEPDLVRIAPPPDDFTLDLWLLTHEDLRQTARIRTFLDFLAEALAKEAPLLEGLSPRTSSSRATALPQI